MADDTLEYSWRVEAGEDDTLTIPVLRDGDPFSVAGRVVDAVIKTRPGGAVLYAWPAELATISADGLSVVLVVPGEVSLTWAFTSGWYRVKVALPTGDPDPQRLLNGPFIVDPD